jgi:TrpR family trp operon transcriptional repressor
MTDQKNIQELASLVANIGDKKSALEFLQNILTPQELEEIAKRLQIFKMLHAGVSQRAIAEKLGVSIGTVSRGSRELQYGPPGIKKLL